MRTASRQGQFPSTGLPVTLMRGGTSKGVFIDGRDLPRPGPARDNLLLDLMGSPDPMQLDGLGGTHSSTSKVIALAPADDPDVDVDYTFTQVGTDTSEVDHVGNCGNLTAAVGPYAIDAGWVPIVEPLTPVRLRNLNTGMHVKALVPVVAGRAATHGEQKIAGVPTPGPRIVTEYLNPAGSVFGTVFPTGSPLDLVGMQEHSVAVSLVDVAHPVAFARATDAGYDPALTPAEANARPALLERLERLRSACASLLPATGRTPSKNLPRLVLVLPPVQADQDAGIQLRVVGVSAGRVHHALPVTSTLCTAAALYLPATLPADLAFVPPAGGDIRIAHPKGIVAATVQMAETGADMARLVQAVGIVRTARRLLDGIAHLREPYCRPS